VALCARVGTGANPHPIRVMNTMIAVRNLSFGAAGLRPAERKRRLVRDFY
jgi:hypothetical protein